MRRSKTIVIAALLGMTGAALPIAGALYVSWTLAIKAEQERLSDFAGRVITRANKSLAEVSDSLHAASRSRAAPCSAEHIADMRRLSVEAPSVEEIGYFENGLLVCTSWGPTESRIEYVPGDYKTKGGIEVIIRMQPLVTGGKPMMALHYGSYNALADPMRFVDVIVDPGIQIAVAAENGELISDQNGADTALLKSLMGKPSAGIAGDRLYAMAQRDGWTAIAMEPSDGILKHLRREQLLLLPIGAFISMFIVGIVIWMSRRRLSPQGELAIAIERREFVVEYQPIVELKTGRCIGGEALVRWRRPDGTLVRPDHFIPLAEESGLIAQITDQVIEAVVADLGNHLVADPSLHIAVNLSAADVKSGRVLPVIGETLKDTGIRREQIWLEATERGFMDIESAKATITLARQLGHAVAIDDFGTGYSSLQYLQGLPLNVLKIDKAFVDTIGKHTATSAVISHIIDMARALDLKMVAEGVETELQARYLLSHHVEYAQGWLFSRPLPAHEFVAFYLRNRNASEPMLYQGAA